MLFEKNIVSGNNCKYFLKIDSDKNELLTFGIVLKFFINTNIVKIGSFI